LISLHIVMLLEENERKLSMAEKRRKITNDRANARRSLAEPTKDEQTRQEALGAERQQQEALQRKRYTRRTVVGGLVAVMGLTATVATSCNNGSVVTLTPTASSVIRSRPPYHVYPDFNDSNRYVPSGFMGDYGAIKLTESWTKNPHSDSICIQVVYSGIATQGKRWAGVYWQHPKGNWGTVPSAGIDLNHYSTLSFWVRGELGGEQIQYVVGGIGGIGSAIPSPYPDSLQPVVKTPVIVLTTDWQPQTIHLEGYNLTYVIGGFGWVANNIDNPRGATFYLDDIVYSS
jgi:hypothetical protein